MGSALQVATNVATAREWLDGGAASSEIAIPIALLEPAARDRLQAELAAQPDEQTVFLEYRPEGKSGGDDRFLLTVGKPPSYNPAATATGPSRSMANCQPFDGTSRCAPALPFTLSGEDLTQLNRSEAKLDLLNRWIAEDLCHALNADLATALGRVQRRFPEALEQISFRDVDGLDTTVARIAHEYFVIRRAWDTSLQEQVTVIEEAMGIAPSVPLMGPFLVAGYHLGATLQGELPADAFVPAVVTPFMVGSVVGALELGTGAWGWTGLIGGGLAGGIGGYYLSDGDMTATGFGALCGLIAVGGIQLLRSRVFRPITRKRMAEPTASVSRTDGGAIAGESPPATAPMNRPPPSGSSTRVAFNRLDLRRVNGRPHSGTSSNTSAHPWARNPPPKWEGLPDKIKGVVDQSSMPAIARFYANNPGARRPLATKLNEMAGRMVTDGKVGRRNHKDWVRDEVEAFTGSGGRRYQVTWHREAGGVRVTGVAEKTR
ncbi:MAG: hypothetical protein HYV03_08145 [Deltaproteobacteria bacterium]|nr:hypothetical protein [Deltaproteobacteria bacterium]